MLLHLTVENWMSYREPATLNMVATRERQHRERLLRHQEYDLSLLPIASIYGGNASGKSTFFKALGFIKHFILNGSKPDSLIPVHSYRLSAETLDQPSRFTIEVLVDDQVYEYTFAATRKQVTEEKIVLIKKMSEKVLFDRNAATFDKAFDSSFRKNKFLAFALQGTRPNQLFLTNAVFQNDTTFLPLFHWFRDTLFLIEPESRYVNFENFFDDKNPLFLKMNALLSGYDTGIASLGSEEVDKSMVGPLQPVISTMLENSPDNKTYRLHAPDGERFILSIRNGQPRVRKMVSFHQDDTGKPVRFAIPQESDGSQRLIDLLPAFLSLAENRQPTVIFVDEIDRSLHTLLVRRLLEQYLAGCSPDSRSQLIFTTHDVLLMDQELLRRDEMWVTERNNRKGTTLSSFSEYKDVRYDKDIRKSYLQGRLGGIPDILPGGTKPILGES